MSANLENSAVATGLEKTRDLFKKIRDIKDNISCKDGHNKGQKRYGPNRSRRY